MNKQDYLTGKVLWFNHQRGYGMIASDNGRGDVFFHNSVISGNGANLLSENDPVEFLLDTSRAAFPEASSVWRHQAVTETVPASMSAAQAKLQSKAKAHSKLGAGYAPPHDVTQPEISLLKKKPVGQVNPLEIRRIESISDPQQKSSGSTHHMMGTVLSFNRLKGFGFIEPDDDSEQVYVHFSSLRDDGFQNLFRGDRVKYIPVDDGKGPQATDVFVA